MEERIMKVNSLGLSLIKSMEGCKLTSYKLKGERNYTIGYGHSGSDVKVNQTITQAQADALLRSDLEKFENYVEKNTKFPLNDNQFSALVSYTYNRGYKGFRQLMDNTSNVYDLGNNMVKYWGSNTKYKTALIARRKKERTLFYIPTTSIDIPNPLLKRGSMGTEVERLQKALNQFGYGLKTDGIFGEKTYRTLIDFQKSCGLTPDGIYGKMSQSALRRKLYGN
jgi:GH24 family phage-related lysozyme (muramidase)